jgi:hypothetical protein
MTPRPGRNIRVLGVRWGAALIASRLQHVPPSRMARGQPRLPPSRNLLALPMRRKQTAPERAAKATGQYVGRPRPP